MNPLPAGLREALYETLGIEPMRAKTISGGMICQAARVETVGGPMFVKWKADAPPGFFAAESHSLLRLRTTDTIRVPEVLGFYDADAAPRNGWPPFIALEYIENRPADDPDRFAERFGAELAKLHQHTSTRSQAHVSLIMYGDEGDNYIGALPQVNTPHPDWPSFYRDCRILPQIQIARDGRRISTDLEKLLKQVVDSMDSMLDGLESQPVLLHGDLWSGNFLSHGDQPVAVDPASYYGEREVEIAFMELFGGFPSGVLSAYREEYPLSDGYERRRPLHQLYPLLVHLNHFGESYAPDVERVCRQCL